MTEFEVESVILCDYITTDGGGKAILVGVYASSIVLTDVPEHFPQLALQIALFPYVSQFDLTIRILDPLGFERLRFTGRARSKERPPSGYRYNINLKLPNGLRFFGEGEYKLIVENGESETLHVKSFNVKIGTQEPFEFELVGEAQINNDVG